MSLTTASQKHLPCAKGILDELLANSEVIKSPEVLAEIIALKEICLEIGEEIDSKCWK